MASLYHLKYALSLNLSLEPDFRQNLDAKYFSPKKNIFLKHFDNNEKSQCDENKQC